MLADQAPARSPYGAFPEVIERDWIGRWCHLSRADLDLVDRRRSDTTRLGFAIQLVTVRAIGTFLAEPSDVPELVVRSVAEQIGAHDIGVLGGYGKLAAQWHHVTEIRERYGYQDFTDPVVQSRIDSVYLDGRHPLIVSPDPYPRHTSRQPLRA